MFPSSVGRLPALLLASALCSGCGVARSASDSYLAQTVGANWGPCGGPRDSVRAALGAPAREQYGEEEDISEKTKRYSQEWGYRLPPDSARVVTFAWGDGVRRCQVSERRLSWRTWEREI